MDRLLGGDYRTLKMIARKHPTEEQAVEKCSQARVNYLVRLDYVVRVPPKTGCGDLLFPTDWGLKYLQDHKELVFRDVLAVIGRNILIPIGVSAATTLITLLMKGQLT